MRKQPPLYCSFCRKPAEAVAQLVGGPGVYICGCCVGLCQDVLAGRAAPPFPGFAALKDCELLATLKPASAAVEETRDQLKAHVETLRARNVSWAKIAAALGISRQAAWERFG